MIHFPCNKYANIFPSLEYISFHFPIVYLQKLGIPFFIPFLTALKLTEVDKENGFVMYSISDTSYLPVAIEGRLPPTFTKSVLSLMSMGVFIGEDGGNVVSAFHCQQGQSYDVHKLIPVRRRSPQVQETQRPTQRRSRPTRRRRQGLGSMRTPSRRRR